MKKKRLKVSVKKSPLYPSAHLLQMACYNDYSSIASHYDKIYDRINIALSFCGVILLVVIKSLDYSVAVNLFSSASREVLFYSMFHVISYVISSILLIWALIQLLLLTRSRPLQQFDSRAIRNAEIYRKSEEEASVWLIQKYTDVIVSLRKETEKKQKKFNSALLKLVISIFAFLGVLITRKGG